MTSSIDYPALRARSLLPGGFGDDRAQIWPRLLNVHEEQTKEDEDILDAAPPHPDEKQIQLDTDRSFVLYPIAPGIDYETQRVALQADLNRLIVRVFRKRRKLSYFQGYHDIATVLFLTLPPPLHLPCLEKISLHRLRDAMGKGLDPVLGLLRLTRHLLRLADPTYASLLEQTAPLPFHALSNLLTLFAHDMPVLELIQHVFDWLLCRPPVAGVYLSVVIILSRKNEVARLEEEGEEGMVHSLLSSLPEITNGEREVKVELKTEEGKVKVEAEDTKPITHSPENEGKREEEEEEEEGEVNTEREDEPTHTEEVDEVYQDDQPPREAFKSSADADSNGNGNGNGNANLNLQPSTEEPRAGEGEAMEGVLKVVESSLSSLSSLGPEHAPEASSPSLDRRTSGYPENP